MSASNDGPAKAWFSVLGPLQIRIGGEQIEPGPRQRQLLLAFLLANVGRTVGLGDLVDLLWPIDPPASAVNSIHQHIAALRPLLEPDLPARAEGSWLPRRGRGYCFEADSGSVDLSRFRALGRDACAHADRGDDLTAVELYVNALELWSTPCWEEFGSATELHPMFVAIENERVVAAGEAADLALRCSASEMVLPVLRAATEGRPFDESLHARLLLCMAATGNRIEALTTYERLRVRLAEELGLDPGPEVRAAHDRVVAESTSPSSAPVRPAQLPPGLAAFSGRGRELRVLDDLLGTNRDTPLIVAVDGMPGVGKTTLAIHWAHRVADRFPDGQIYLNLRGFDTRGDAMTDEQAIPFLLETLGVNDEQIPKQLDAAKGMYRSLLASRRLLVILDNARDSEQIFDLLPGTSGSAVIITSRNRLEDLAIQGAEILSLDLPQRQEARDAFERRVGPARVRNESTAVDDIVERCGRLPLAVAMVAARATANPSFSLSAIAEELRTTQDALDAFGGADGRRDLRAIFSWSYRAVSADAGRLFRLLGILDGAPFSLPAAGSIAAVTLRRARVLLAELSAGNLLIEVTPGRFALHDLLKAYAIELSAELETPAERDLALGRLYSFYRQAAHRAHLLLPPVLTPIEPGPPLDGVTVPVFADRVAAFAWFDAERDALGRLIERVAVGAVPGSAWRLGLTVQVYWHDRGQYPAWERAMRAAMNAASAAGDRWGHAQAARSLAGAVAADEHQCRTLLDLSLDLFRELGCDNDVAYVYNNVAMVCRDHGDKEEAIAYGRRAVEMFRTTGNVSGLRLAGFTLATIYAMTDRFDEADLLATEVHELALQADDVRTASAVLALRAEVHFLNGRYKESLAVRRESMRIAEHAGFRIGLAVNTESLGDCHAALGDLGSARDAWREALRLIENGDGHGAEVVRRKLGAPS